MTSHNSGGVHTRPPARSCPFQPRDELTRRLSEEPVSRIAMPGGGTAWLVTRYDDVRRVLSDSDLSSNRGHPGFPQFFPRWQQTLGAALRRAMISLDGQEHALARRAIMGEFTANRLRALRPRVQKIVEEALDAMLQAGSPADLVRDLSLPVPSQVICELLGVPVADQSFFQERAQVMVGVGGPMPAEQARASDEILAYLDHLSYAKERAPELPDDLVGRQIRRQRDHGRVDHDDLVTLTFMLLLAGHETTANMISLGTVALLDDPTRFALLRADPRRIPSTVEELLRVFSIAEGPNSSRVALKDIEIGGVRIRAGEGIIATLSTANHDPEIFDHPMDVDFERGGRHHVAFGHGAHQCLGQNLARLELEVVFGELSRRLPGLRITEPREQLRYKDETIIYGMRELPVAW